MSPCRLTRRLLFSLAVLIVAAPALGQETVAPYTTTTEICLSPSCGAGITPATPHQIFGVDCFSQAGCKACGEVGWNALGPIEWQRFAQGEYLGPHRQQHVPEYRLRVDDQVDFVFRVTRDRSPEPYQLNIGDTIRVEVFADETLNRELTILPDGTVVLLLIGEVQASGMTADQLRAKLETLYRKYYKQPNVAVTPLLVNTKLEDLRATVDARQGVGGQVFNTRVTPDGSIALPAIGNVPVNGMTLGEVKREADERYNQVVYGIEVTPVLVTRAPRFIYVLGEVGNPGRFELVAPTTLTQALALAGSWNVGANLNQVVVFRRADDWRLLATMVDIRGALFAKQPCPSDEIWLRDSDIIIVPQSPVLQFDNFVDLVFTRGIYGVLPGQATAVQFTRIGSL